MSDASLWWAVAAGGALGALFRAAVYAALAKRTRRHHDGALAGLGLARATLLVNLIGSFLLGLSAMLLPMASAMTMEDEPMRVLLVTGFCGSLTTFSTLCLDVVGLARANRRAALVGFLLANGVLSVTAFGFGLRIAGG